VAVLGDGYFQIQMPDGTTSYSRDGNFKISNTGQIVTALGFPLVPAITIPNNAASVTIGQDGTTSVELIAGARRTSIRTNSNCTFCKPKRLEASG
jgi:flagellar basal-body rod protein FlgG